MKDAISRWCIRFDLFFLTAFSVFLLPFMLPPAVIEGVSAANAAGFNNKVAALAAALCSLLVFAFEYRWPDREPALRIAPSAKLPWPLVWSVTIACGLAISAMSYAFALSGVRYADESYFLDQIGKYVDCGRVLYEQIEFPYGPLLFYGPVWIRALLGPAHLSLTTAYYVTLVLEHCVGLLLVAYILNCLQVARTWKIVFFLLAALQTYPFSIGLNYTHFRFVAPIALLIGSTQQKKIVTTALCLFAGEFISLSLSPEMGFAFAAAGTAYGMYLVFVKQYTWILAAGSPAISALVFLAVAGSGYLRMLKLFAHGIYNLVVEPLPYILVFVFALVWLVPRSLAGSLQARLHDAPRLAAVYVFALALLPVAFGRADPAHVYFNGFAVLLLSLASIASLRFRTQLAWMILLAGALLYTAAIDVRGALPRVQDALLHAASLHPARPLLRGMLAAIGVSAGQEAAFHSSKEPEAFNLDTLQHIVGNAPVATPVFVPYSLVASLKASGQYVPQFYSFTVAVLDRPAEERQVRELNVARWALLPHNARWQYYETPETTAGSLGMHLPYAIVRAPYVVGKIFDQNLDTRWRLVTIIGSYELYRRL